MINKISKHSLILLITLLLSFGCTSSSSTKLDSADFATPEERVAVLKKEIKTFSHFEDAAFELFNVNGFTTSQTLIPGASSWDYKFALKMEPKDLDKWIVGMNQVELDRKEMDWTKEMVAKRNADWQLNSQASFYARKNADVVVILYRQEGLLFKRTRNL